MRLVSGEILISFALTVLVFINKPVSDLLLDGNEMDFRAGELGVSPFANLAVEQLELVRDRGTLVSQ